MAESYLITYLFTEKYYYSSHSLCKRCVKIQANANCLKLLQMRVFEVQNSRPENKCIMFIEDSWYLYSWLFLIFFSFLFSSWNWASWRKTKSGVPLANLQATSPAESIHLWFVLQEKSNQQRYPELSFDLNKSLPYFFVFGVWYDLLWQHSIYYLLLLFYTLYALQMHFAILLEYLWVLGHLYCDVETWQRKLI